MVILILIETLFATVFSSEFCTRLSEGDIKYLQASIHRDKHISIKVPDLPLDLGIVYHVQVEPKYRRGGCLATRYHEVAYHPRQAFLCKMKVEKICRHGFTSRLIIQFCAISQHIKTLKLIVKSDKSLCI